MKKLIVFDLDGTLAESKSAIDTEAANSLAALLEVVQVAIISGGDWPQFEKQILMHLPADTDLRRLSILPTCGTKFFQFDGGWKKLYSEDFTEDQKTKITEAFHGAIDQLKIRPEKTWGEMIEDRGSQITFSALGQAAPVEEKKRWDPDFAKRKQIQALLEKQIPDFSIRLGGTTSVDVTRPGIDKAYGIRKLRDILDISIEEMLFVGDALFPGGNDYPALEAGVASICVRDPDETKRIIETIIACVGLGFDERLVRGESSQ